MEIGTILALGFICLACFLAGARIGQTAAKGEDIKLPSFNPVQAVRDHRSRKQVQKEQDRYSVILQNIDSYNGTEIGQRDVPRR